MTLFLGLVVVLPLLTKKRTQCSFLCPFGAFQSIFNKTGAFDIRIDQSKCIPCVLCEKACPTLSITPEAVRSGKPLMSCMKCGACVDACVRDAAVWHIKGTEVGRVLGAGAPDVPLLRLGFRRDVRRKHHRRHPGEDSSAWWSEGGAMKKLRSILGNTGAVLTLALAVLTPFLLFGWFQSGHWRRALAHRPHLLRRRSLARNRARKVTASW